MTTARDATPTTCDSCRFYDTGECHRYAPMAAAGIGGTGETTTWPNVQSSDWCGEYQSQTGPAQ